MYFSGITYKFGKLVNHANKNKILDPRNYMESQSIIQ